MADVTTVGDSNLTSMVDNVPGLTEEEKSKLMSVMIKAKELDAQEENKMRQPLEGQLFKYTNVVKGWQYRWFVLNPEIGTFEYYMLDEVKKQRPRGAVHLAGAVISPSEEDGQMFTVSAACGEVYKLRAQDARERQFWINRLRSAAEDHNQTIAQKNPPLLPREIRSSPHSGTEVAEKSSSHTVWHMPPPTSIVQSASSVAEAFSSVREKLYQASFNHRALVNSIEKLPGNGPHSKFFDTDMLLLKAASYATLLCLEQCLSILQEQQYQIHPSYPTGLPAGATVEWLDAHNVSESAEEQNQGDWCEVPGGAVTVQANPSGEISDTESEEEDGTIPAEENKEEILHLLSELKLGMDVTKVTLPPFVLEPRSLLETFSDFFDHPDFFVKIADAPSPEDRIISVLEWFLVSLYASRKSLSAKKPYNPILGETFHCSWRVPTDSTQVTLVAEQVSHHPPVSAIYVEYMEKKMVIRASICVKANFMGMYVVAPLTGELQLSLYNRNETYVITLPSLFCRSILSMPYFEMGGRVTITCSESKCHASVSFHSKPFYGGSLHSVTGEAKSAANEVICKVSGEWDHILTLNYADGSSKSHNVRTLPKIHKRVRPLDSQDSNESRRQWHKVTQALIKKDYRAAATHKLQLEDKQRKDEIQRQQNGVTFEPKLFVQEANSWSYKYPLSAGN